MLNIAIVILCGEIYARIKHGDTLGFKSAETMYRKADFEFHHSFIPGAKGRSITKEWDIPYSINSFGLRDHEYPMEKSEDTFRILALGDSFTE